VSNRRIAMLWLVRGLGMNNLRSVLHNSCFCAVATLPGAAPSPTVALYYNCPKSPTFSQTPQYTAAQRELYTSQGEHMIYPPFFSKSPTLIILFQ
jgi:hypothetical protein